MTIEEIKLAIEKEAQSIFDKHAKPAIKKQMRRFGVVSIEQVMGVDFFKFKDGSSMSEREFTESSPKRKEFYQTYIEPWQENPFRSMINYDMNI